MCCYSNAFTSHQRTSCKQILFYLHHLEWIQDRLMHGDDWHAWSWLDRQWQGRRLNNGVQVQLISILHINSCYCTYIRIERKRNGSCLAWQACRHSVSADIPSQPNPMMVSCTMLSTCCTAATVWREARCNVWLRMDLALPTYYCLPVPIIWTPQLLFFFSYAWAKRSCTHARNLLLLMEHGNGVQLLRHASPHPDPRTTCQKK